MFALRSRAICIPRAHSSSRLAIAARMRYYSVVVNAPRPNKTKIWDSVEDAIKDVKSGDVVFAWTWNNNTGNREFYMNWCVFSSILDERERALTTMTARSSPSRAEGPVSARTRTCSSRSSPA